MQSLDDLIKTVEKLRSPEGCPWDKEQTFKSLVPCIIEECYELVEAIESNTVDAIIEAVSYTHLTLPTIYSV